MGAVVARIQRHPRRILVALLVIASVSYGIFWWLDGGKRLFYPRKFASVTEGFYRAGQIHRRLIKDVLVWNDIDLVIDLAKDQRGDLDAATEREVTKRLRIPLLEFHGLSGNGSGDIEQYIGALAAVVEARAAGQNVLVHCAAGSERAGTLVAFYRMLYQGWEGPRAYEEYRSFRKRPPTEPLVAHYVNQHWGEVGAALVARGLLDEIPELPAGFGPAGSSSSIPAFESR